VSELFDCSTDLVMIYLKSHIFHFSEANSIDVIHQRVKIIEVNFPNEFYTHGNYYWLGLSMIANYCELFFASMNSD
jgi:hypothetical protein